MRPYTVQTDPKHRDYIIDMVCKWHGTTVAEMYKYRRSRKPEHLKVRQQIAFIIKCVYPDYPLQRIAEDVGRKSHVTLIRARDRVQGLYATEPDYRLEFNMMLLTMPKIDAREVWRWLR